MRSWRAFLSGAKFKKSTSETTLSPADPPFEKQQSFSSPPQIRIQRSHSSASLSMFRRRNKQSIDSPRGSDDIEVKPFSETARMPEQSLQSHSMSATNGLATLRMNTPSSLSPSVDTSSPSNISRNIVSEERTSTVSPQSQPSKLPIGAGISSGCRAAPQSYKDGGGKGGMGQA